MSDKAEFVILLMADLKWLSNVKYFIITVFKLRSPYTNNLEQFRTVPAEKGHLFRSAVDSLH